MYIEPKVSIGNSELASIDEGGTENESTSDSVGDYDTSEVEEDTNKESE